MQALRAEPAAIAKVIAELSVIGLATHGRVCCPVCAARLVYVKRIGAVSRQVGIHEMVTHLMPLVKKISTDTEAVIRQALCQELGGLAPWLADPSEVRR